LKYYISSKLTRICCAYRHSVDFYKEEGNENDIVNTLLKSTLAKYIDGNLVCISLFQKVTQLCYQQVYLLLLAGTFCFPPSVAGISLFSENSTIAAAYTAITTALESFNLGHIIENLLNKSENPDQHLTTVNIKSN
jgi:hypothetical protein